MWESPKRPERLENIFYRLSCVTALPEDPAMRLYHNPRCSKSRAALELLRSRGLEVEVIEYLQDTPSPEALRDVLARLGIAPRELLRSGEAEYASLGLDATDIDDDTLVREMSAHPQLIERPIFVCGGRAVIGRPPERVLDLLDAPRGH